MCRCVIVVSACFTVSLHDDRVSQEGPCAYNDYANMPSNTMNRVHIRNGTWEWNGVQLNLLYYVGQLRASECVFERRKRVNASVCD